MSHKQKKKHRSAYRDPTEGRSEDSVPGKLRLNVKGMHCASCEVLIERRFKKVPGVETVRVNQAAGRAEVAYSAKPSLLALQESLAGTDYTVALQQAGNAAQPSSQPAAGSAQEYIETGYVFMIVVTFYLILKALDLIPEGLSVSDNMNYPFIFAIGLVAAVSSCIAVTGGLLVSVAGRYAETHPNLAGWQKFKPQLYFNIGRVAGYTMFGGLVGAVGSVFTLSTRMTGVLTLAASLIMVVLGFQLLNIFPGVQRLMPKMPKLFAHKVHDAGNSSESKAGPFILGASTFFLPCGFTQALQLYVLSTGSFTVGALTMLAFSLGTLPALLSLSALSSFLKGATQRHFFRFAGVIVILLGLSNMRNGLALAGTNINLASVFSSGSTKGADVELVPLENGKQIVRMKVDGLEYTPAQFKVRQGVPVEWHIDGTEAAGCAGVVIAYDFNVTVSVAGNSDKVVTFTPNKTGTFEFNCPMGMATQGAAFIVVPNKTDSPTQGPGGTGAARGSSATTLSPTAEEPPPADAQLYTMTVTEAQGFYPNQFKAKKGLPVVLTVDVQADLGGCMSTMIGSDYDIATQLKPGKNKVRFTPTQAGTVYLYCPMGAPMGEIEITE